MSLGTHITCSIRIISPISLNRSHLHITKRFYRRWYKPPTRNIYHPYISEPEYLSLNPSFKSAVLDESQLFIPKNFSRDLILENMRSGQNLGSDYPWNLLKTNSNYRYRLYNVKYEEVPWMISDVKGVEYYPRLHVFAANWIEDGIHRIRWFRCAHGITRAKRAAERFKLKLEATGRVDNMKSERQKRMDIIRKNVASKLRQKRYAKITRGFM